VPERVMPIAPNDGRSTHPVLFLLMFVPMGISNGYVVVTLAYLLAAAGVSVKAIAVLGVWSLVPQLFKVIGGPLVDATLTNKAWYLVSSVVTGLLIAATALLPSSVTNLTPITVLVFLISVASAFSALAADSIMAHATTEEEKGRAGGWSQAGNLGGSAIGGGLGLWLSQNLTPEGNQAAGRWLAEHTGSGWFADAGLWLGHHISAGVFSGCGVGLLCVVSTVALLWVHEPPAEHRGIGFAKSLVNVGKDLWSLLSSHRGLVAFVAMCLPISVGAMTQLWSAVASDWHASANWVALINGMLGGIITMVGCIVGGWMCDRMNRMAAFNIFSLITVVLVIGMIAAPRTELTYIIFVGLYMLITGFCYAAFGAVVLEAIGKGAAATKYNLLAGIANGPIMYLSWLDGKAHDLTPPSWLAVDGTTLMLLTEAIVPVIGTLVLVGFIIATRSFFKGKPKLA
jgi:MFS transporter, PAT family, beta-lactamase induction signal transducer AmpG